MTDIRTALRSASPPPPVTLGIMGVLEAKRAQRHRRRRIAWLGLSGLLALGLGGPVTASLVQSSPSARVETQRPSPDVDDRTVPNDEHRRVKANQPSRPQVTTRPAASGADHKNAETPPPAAVNQTAPEGCRVDRRSTSNVQLSDGGAGWNEYPSCSYLASRAGGYVAKGSWRIEIVRRGATLTIHSSDAPACAANVIEPGDQVTVFLRKGVNSPSDWFIAVGSDQHC